MRKNLDKLSMTHAKTNEGRGKDFGETHVQLEMTGESDALRVMVGELEKELEMLCDAPKEHEEKIQGLVWKVASDAQAITHHETIVKDHRSNCLRVTAEYGELQYTVNNIKGNFLEIVLYADQLQAKVNSIDGEWDA